MTFTPKWSGVRYGAATLSSSGATIATGYVYGTGVGPQVSFSPAALTALHDGFNYPNGIAIDGSGNVYVADQTNNAVKEILAAGGYATVNTLGSGFSQPVGVAVDGAGNVFVANTGTLNDIKEILAAGGYTVVRTLGSGFNSPNGVAVDGSGNVFVADSANIKEIPVAGGYTTVTTLASGFNYLIGITLDSSGNVFVADVATNLVSEIVAAGGYTTVRTLGSGFNEPAGVAVDGEGNLFVSDFGNNAIKEMLVAGAYTTINTLGDGLNGPIGVAVDGAGNIFFADSNSNTIKQLNVANPPALNFLTTLAGSTSSDSPKAVTLINNGNAALTFEVPGTGLNPSISADFTFGNSSTCPQLSTSSSVATLATGASCTNLISFAPTESGSITSSLVETDNAMNAVGPNYATQTVPLNGTATAPPATKLASTTITSSLPSGGNLGTISATVEDANGNTVNSSSALVTTTITGPNGYSQAVAANAVSGVATLNLGSLALTTPGVYTVTSASPGLTSVSSSVTVLAGNIPTQLALSAVPASLAFGGHLGVVIASIENSSQSVVTSSTAYVSLTITGPSGYSNELISSALAGVTPFDLSSISYMAPGSYVITATSNGLTQATASFTVGSSPAVANFGSIPVGTSSPVTSLIFTLYTSGTIQLPSVVTQGSTGLDFVDAGTGSCTTNGTSHSYEATTTCTVDVTFNPVAPGRRSGAIVLKDASGNALATAFLNGVGSAPLVAFDAGLITSLPLALTTGISNPDVVRSGPRPQNHVGPAPTNQLDTVVEDSSGNLFVVDGLNCVVQKFVAGSYAASIIAGTGSCGYNYGDGGPATSAQFRQLNRIAIDGRGDLYLPDALNYVIRKVDAITGIITTVAGQRGVTGYVPGGGLATSITFDNPNTVAVDGKGNLYIGDQGTSIIWKLTRSTGVLTILAGNGTGVGYSGDGGLATAAQLGDTNALTLDAAGNLYIADGTNNIVRKVTVSTGVITTYAGTPSSNPIYSGDGGLATQAQIVAPAGVSVDAAGSLYIAEGGSAVIRKVNASTGRISTIAGVYHGGNGSYTGDGGAATLAGFSEVQDVAVDGLGNFFVADSGNNVIRKVAPGTGVASFGSFAIGSSSPAIDVIVSNNGNAILDISDLRTLSNFNLAGTDTTCTATGTLAIGASCVLGIEFLPTTAGPLSSTTTLTDNANNVPAATQSVTLNGTGISPTASQLALSSVSSTIPFAGNLGAERVSIENANGALNVDSTASITLTLVGPAGSRNTYTVAAVNGVAAFDLSSLPLSAIGIYSITATSPNLNSATAAFTVVPITTATAVRSSSLTPLYGETVVLTATVTPPSTDTPTGTVAFHRSGVAGGVGPVLGTSPINASGIATLSVVLPGGANVVTGVYSGSLDFSGSSSPTLSISTIAATAVSFSASPTTQLYNNPIVLTAQATSATAGILTGTVSFLDGTIVIATVPLGANGRAIYSIATLVDGSHSLTAAYSGDPNFQPSGSTGAAVAITVGNVNLNLGGDQNQSVVTGGAVAYSFPLSPLVTPTFLYDVHLTATGLPPGATYTFSPAVIPAGSGSMPVTLTVQTAKGTARLSMPAAPGQHSPRGLTALAFGLLLPLLGAKSVRRRLKAMPKPLAMILFAVLSIGAMAGVSGCGSGGFFGATSTSGKYTITVTATSADLVRTSTVQLTIQ
ncbi:MAG: Ig-like domain repeat protein [Acidobacteriaceae bacterium]